MKSHKAAVRYSKAWFDLAIERGDIESCYNDVNLVLSVLAENKELKVMLKSPVIKQDTKAKFLSKIFGSKINKLTNSFVEILVRKRREFLLESICKSYVDRYKAHHHIVTAEIASAIQLDGAERERIIAIANSINSGKIELNEEINSDLIGGFILQVGDKQLDESVSRKLSTIKLEIGQNYHTVKNN
jgi:F-type H+-transporting ATPase subunit delta